MSWYRPLTERIKDVPQKGRVMWIGVRPAHEVAMIESTRIEVIEAKGLVGDRASKGRIGGKRQVFHIHRIDFPVTSINGLAQPPQDFFGRLASLAVQEPRDIAAIRRQAVAMNPAEAAITHPPALRTAATRRARMPAVSGATRSVASARPASAASISISAPAGTRRHLRALGGIHADIDLGEGNALAAQQGLGAVAIRTKQCRVDHDPARGFLCLCTTLAAHRDFSPAPVPRGRRQ
jgi:hypothetical protein